MVVERGERGGERCVLSKHSLELGTLKPTLATAIGGIINKSAGGGGGGVMYKKGDCGGGQGDGGGGGGGGGYGTVGVIEVGKLVRMYFGRAILQLIFQSDRLP